MKGYIYLYQRKIIPNFIKDFGITLLIYAAYALLDTENSDLYSDLSSPLLTCAVIIPCYLIRICSIRKYYIAPGVLCRYEEWEKWWLCQIKTVILFSATHSCFLTLLRFATIALASGFTGAKMMDVAIMITANAICTFLCFTFTGLLHILLADIASPMCALTVTLSLSFLDFGLSSALVLFYLSRATLPSGMNLSEIALHCGIVAIPCVLLMLICGFFSGRRRMNGGYHAQIS